MSYNEPHQCGQCRRECDTYNDELAEKVDDKWVRTAIPEQQFVKFHLCTKEELAKFKSGNKTKMVTAIEGLQCVNDKDIHGRPV